jgi:hypothetical protein
MTQELQDQILGQSTYLIHGNLGPPSWYRRVRQPTPLE